MDDDSENSFDQLCDQPEYQCVHILETTVIYESEHIVPKLGFFELQQVLEIAKLDWSGTRQVLQKKILTFLKSNRPAMDESLRAVFRQSIRNSGRLPRLIDLSPIDLHLCMPDELGLEGFENCDEATVNPTNITPKTLAVNSSTYDLKAKMLRFYISSPELVALPKYEPYMLFRFSRLSYTNGKPSQIYMTINNGPVLITTSWHSVRKQSNKTTMDIIVRLRLKPVAKNKLMVKWWPIDKKANHCLAVILMNRLTASHMFEILQAKCPIPLSETRDRLANIFDFDRCPNGSMMSNMLSVSLLCPVGGTRMKVPCRGLDCEHVQCFDAWLYLLANEREPHWLCPVCQKPAAFDNLLIDEYFSQVLASNELDKSDISINVLENGDWLPVSRSKNLLESRRRSFIWALSNVLPSHYAPTVDAISELPGELEMVPTIRPLTGQAPLSHPVNLKNWSGYKVNIYLLWEDGKIGAQSHTLKYTPDSQ